MSCDELLKLLKQHLQHTQQCMKLNANKSYCKLQLKPNNLVLVHVQPYRQTIVADQVSHKLSCKCYGPFLVLESKSRSLSYPKMSVKSQIHNIHISILKPCTGDQSVPTCQFPLLSMDNKLLFIPQAILASQYSNLIKEISRLPSVNFHCCMWTISCCLFLRQSWLLESCIVQTSWSNKSLCNGMMQCQRSPPGSSLRLCKLYPSYHLKGKIIFYVQEMIQGWFSTCLLRHKIGLDTPRTMLSTRRPKRKRK